MSDLPLGKNAITVTLDPKRWEKRGERYYPKGSRSKAWGESKKVLVELRDQLDGLQGKKATLTNR